MANVFEPSYDDTSEREGFAGRRARIGRQAGAEHLGASLFELEPGSAPFPLHFHLGRACARPWASAISSRARWSHSHGASRAHTR